MRRVFAFFSVSAWLWWNIIISTFRVAWTAITPGPVGTPVIVKYPMLSRTELEVTVLAWAITVTPGTLVTVIGQQSMWVHVILGGPREQIIAELQDVENRILSVLRGKEAPGR